MLTGSTSKSEAADIMKRLTQGGSNQVGSSRPNGKKSVVRAMGDFGEDPSEPIKLCYVGCLAPSATFAPQNHSQSSMSYPFAGDSRETSQIQNLRLHPSEDVQCRPHFPFRDRRSTLLFSAWPRLSARLQEAVNTEDPIPGCSDCGIDCYLSS